MDKLNAANAAVEEMRKVLKLMQPELEKSSEETEKMMVKLKVEKEEASEKQKQVAKDEMEASKQAAEARELARDAEQKVADANIILEKTLAEVKKLRKDHLVEVRSFTTPSEVVRLVCQALVILNIDSIKKKGGEITIKAVKDQIGKKEEDYFDTAKRYLLNDPKDLLEVLDKYDKNHIKPQFIAKIENQCKQNPQFTFERAEQSSYAIKFLFM